MNNEKKKDAINRPSYKETLNLLKTNFSMRANSIVREPELQKFWEKEKYCRIILPLSKWWKKAVLRKEAVQKKMRGLLSRNGITT